MVDVAALKRGSVVRLISGSAKLTVEHVDARGNVHLIGWSDRCGAYRFDVHPACLTWPRSADDRQAEDAA